MGERGRVKAGGSVSTFRDEKPLYCRAMHALASEIERWYRAGTDASNSRAARQVFEELRAGLTDGSIRAAEKRDGEWRVNVWVKQGILLGFRLGELTEFSPAGA